MNLIYKTNSILLKTIFKIIFKNFVYFRVFFITSALFKKKKIIFLKTNILKIKTIHAT